MGSLLRGRGGAVAVRTGFVFAFVLMGAAVLHAAPPERALSSALPSAKLISNDTTARKPAKSPTKTPPKKVFSKRQLQNDRVLAARYEKRFEIKKLFRDRGVQYPAAEIFVRIFKRERQLELWARSEGQDTFSLLKSYEICALADKPGPKRKQGDMQTPEGFYYIDNFNPRSGYHLSLHIDYPNQSDRMLGATPNLGGDIFIHGGCKTEGCMAVTDESIKEIYWIAVEARDNGQQRIPVHIFPTRLTDNNLAQLVNVFAKESELIRFWSNLKPGYDYFAQHKKLPELTVNPRGRYQMVKKSLLLGEPMTPAKADTTVKGN